MPRNNPPHEFAPITDDSDYCELCGCYREDKVHERDEREFVAEADFHFTDSTVIRRLS